MSGICGICQPGVELPRRNLDEMLAACSLPEESGCESLLGNSIALGVSRRWPNQQTGKVRGVRIALDADLYNSDELSALLEGEGLPRGQLSLAEAVANLLEQVRDGFFLGHIAGDGNRSICGNPGRFHRRI